MDIDFLLNGERVELRGVGATTTLLDWLREARGLTGTKEGCNEGDCGACSVMVTDADGARALNACILFLPQLHGKAVRTVEGIAGPDGALHPVQDAMIARHGSQCGFCTPGFIVTMAVAHLNDDRRHDDALAGNLCRCTGYAPIVRAAEDAAAARVPAWMHDDAVSAAAIDDTAAGLRDRPPYLLTPGPGWEAPETLDSLLESTAARPEATLIAGATDVGLWVTKGLQDLGEAIFLGRCRELQEITVEDDTIRIGAGVTMDRVHRLMAGHHPSYAEMIRRYGGGQVRAAATIGGNIANGSPIGDNPPPLIALGATLHLAHAAGRREMPLEDFFLEYGRQDLRPGEIVEAVSLPAQAPRMKVWKISKRFDQDISAICGAFDISVADGRVTATRIAFGGMAGVPKRAEAVERALIGQRWSGDAIAAAWDAFAADFQPLSDMRASSDYRLMIARNLLARYLLEDLGAETDVLKVAP
ncbi:xanthine dehydrogenase small subunit [Roseivivax sediminis]|uniref:Xanthine dehydrogenase small subunit n=1 Tax=Roseivivax sediminis TaxID=936889 RepID=A0A1I1SPM2_9RHOB|nr:xanthine dehydrogenase small subunit [Roseivivax sediminis]SFD48272.1 xanthine dehydrogenase small subunit [Roseivivax sediminis]